MASEECLDDSIDESPPNVATPSSMIGGGPHGSGILSPALLGSTPTTSSLGVPGSAFGGGLGAFLIVPNGLHPGHAASAAAQLLSIDQISLNSQSSSAYNSCPYTPLNSVADEDEDYDGSENRPYYGDDDSSACPSRRGRASGPPSSIPTPPNYPARPASASSTITGGGVPSTIDVCNAAAAAVAGVAASRRQLGPRNLQQLDILPSFNSRDMLERIEYKRLKMKAARGWDHTTSGETSPNVYPFTPKNSFVDSTFEEAYRNRDNTGLENLEPDQIAKKVEEKKRFYRLDLDEAQGALHGIAEGDADEDVTDFPATFSIDLDHVQSNVPLRSDLVEVPDPAESTATDPAF